MKAGEGKCEAREDRSAMKEQQQWRRDRAWKAREPIQALSYQALLRISHELLALVSEEGFKTPSLTTSRDCHVSVRVDLKVKY